jgi:deazaflavin-dependent oxidoreductase (nitroreductase family)
MSPDVAHALKHDNLVDITTIGRKSGKPHRIEIAFHNFEDGLYISGIPGRRDWYANLVAHPEFTMHVKQSAHADLPAQATPITDEPTRRRILTQVMKKWNRERELEQAMKTSPLVKVQLENQ